jgi:hypothetical protein
LKERLGVALLIKNKIVASWVKPEKNIVVELKKQERPKPQNTTQNNCTPGRAVSGTEDLDSQHKEEPQREETTDELPESDKNAPQPEQGIENRRSEKFHQAS